MDTTVFVEFFEKVSTASFGFAEIGAMINGFIANLFASEHFAPLWEMLWGYIGFITPYIPFILLAFYAVVALFGKKLFSILRFLAFFVVGFALGVYFLSPLILGVLPAIPTWVIGLVVGIVAAVLSKLLYILTIALAAGYSVYLVCYTALIPFLETLTKGNWMISLGVAAVVILLMFLLLKYVEMLGTAVLGGFGIATVVRGFYDFTTLLPGMEWLAMLIVTAVIALLGFIVQFRMRERY